ncbi:pyridine nucleotide-disulfide oxidoreductase [Neisseria arctica]|uniref:Pyridine nucleotide-disulfide oxidoreductase n=1 Tax=Neisseria arctica TaxID=1470200 RepID=A0A0J0YUJ2_9NEIS|nr:TIGR01244 family sulfur transferase [Neisseria arctica]KLT73781.1 pyridine nucleotide-disulfide oxidoreductase [Neisseria arctica]UOO87036.1 TIGR01244 family sulfur transferase [Neisseria arctica]
MSIRKLDDNLYIAPQLSEEDIQKATELGIQTVICNRPDGEEENQPSFNTICQWLDTAGIRHHVHQPVTAPAINTEDAAKFDSLRQQHPAPVLAYCRTGTRSTLLWAYTQAEKGKDSNEILEAARSVGVDLSNFSERLNNLSR